MVYGLFIAVVAGAAFALGIALIENNNAIAQQQQQQQQQQQNQTSIPHNAKGHQSHQVIIFQNASDGVRYTGTVTFNLSNLRASFHLMTLRENSPQQTQQKLGKWVTKYSPLKHLQKM